ncbi:hypothetical protein PINS_up008354 [Pythium insidiosum]|nr:hypothetical protein PINS_up008354 [Pythium insidiosum]
MMEALLALNDPAAATTRSSNRLFNVLRDKSQLHEAARVIQRMVVFASELTSPTMAVAVAEIERLSQTIETDLLAEFSDAQERRQDRVMRQCATSLIEYSDREKVADRYVWNVMKDRLAKANDTDAASALSLDPMQDLDSLFDKIDAVCRDEFAVIARVFPSDVTTSLRELLVERLFSDPAFGILSYLEQLLSGRSASVASASDGSGEDARSSASAEYVRLLCAAYERTCALAARIEAIELPASATRPALSTSAAAASTFSPLNEATESSSASDNNGSSSSNDRERMHAFLQLQLHSLFGSHRQRYVRTELDLLQRQFKELLASVRWPQPPVVSKKTAGSKGAKADKHNSSGAGGQLPPSTPTPTSTTASVTASVVAATPTSGSSTNIERDAMASTAAEPAAAVATTASYVETLLAIAQDDDLPTLYADEMRAALTRCDVILKDSEMRGELVTKLFSTFCAAFGEELLAVCVAAADQSIHRVSNHRKRSLSLSLLLNRNS